MKQKIKEYLADKQPHTMDQLAEALNQTKAKDFITLVKLISKMESTKELIFTRDGKVALPPKKEWNVPTIKGTFRAHKNGFGFVSIVPEEEDLFVGRNDVNYAIEGDTVEVLIKKVADPFNGVAAEAKVIDILEHAFTSAVGLLILDDEKPKYAGYIKPKNQKINQRIYVKKSPLVLDGTEIIKVDIEKYPCKKHNYFIASLREIIGHKEDAGIDVLEVLESMDIVSEFPEAVLQEAERIPEIPSEAERRGRLDLREEITFTIDGADAKDLDDAVHIKRLPNGHMELGVHIADVSYYVTEGSALDQEALKRGTSVYVTDRVVPMLPERLSNGICSLNPNVDRLTQSAIMEIDSTGKVVKSWIGQTVIHTTYRMTYTDVNAMLAGDEEKCTAFDKIVPSISLMAELHHLLEGMRMDRGALQFDTSEAKIVVNKEGLPVDIILRQRGIAERMIESFMLMANETVAEYFAKLEVPFIYRIHEEPKTEKLQKFIDYASSFGLPIYGTANAMQSAVLQELMKKIKDEPFADILNTMLLRSMQQARYSEHNHGHYGLGADYYTHFTSPIRRYPDLLVHRMVREYVHLTEEKVEHFEKILPEIAKQASRLERRAVDAEREVEAMKKAEYMQEFVGEEFDGVISSVVKFGLFVELPNTVEGLIHITNLSEYFHYNERTLSLHGEKSGLVFRVGQAIRIKVVKSEKMTGEIDFAHIPSDMDTIEKNRTKKETPRGNKKSQRGDKKKLRATSYKKGDKKGGKHGKRRRTGRRTK